MTDVTEAEAEPKRRPVSEEKLKQLQVAREKALEKRRMLGELARKERQMKEDQLHQRISRVKEYEAAHQSLSAHQPVAKRRKPKTDELEEEEAESGSEAEIEEPKPKVRVEQKPKRSVRTNNELISASNRELTAQIAKEELQRRIARENMEVAFKSLFPQHYFVG